MPSTSLTCAHTRAAVTLDVPFVDTAAEELTFAMDHARLPSLRHTVVPIGPATHLELHVLGCSHQAILVHQGQDTMIETVACVPDLPAHLPERHVTELAEASGHASCADPLHSGGPRHEFTAHVDRLDSDAFQSAVARIGEQARRSRYHCLVEFPGQPGAVTALALTCQVEPTGPEVVGGLAVDSKGLTAVRTAAAWSWQTWHCYPQHGQIVTTRSTLQPLTCDPSTSASHHV